MTSKLRALALPFLAALLLAQPLAQAAPRVLPEGTLPNDQRLQPPKDLNGYFPFKPAQSPDEWSARAERVRRQILVSLGLWPMPAKTPLDPVLHGKIDRPDYTVEKVFFQSLPGFYVTGNLYRPKNKPGPHPGVLCPHGHWSQGRFYDNQSGIRQELDQGAEKHAESGRSPLQARCVQLARMGCVVFHYDMLGNADSQQISLALAHGFAKQRPEMNTTENWGLFSPQAEAHFQSVMGLQTWNSIRSLDFLAGLSDVDPQRLAVTGASGGGTQTFILSAIDPRPAVSFPAVMVSTAMQGGCTCENASNLRIGTGNVEFAALFAPKPLGLTAANDWTKEMETKGFPELKQHFQMLGVPDHVQLTPLIHFGHNYNYVSRAAMYHWLNQHLHLGLKEPIIEEDFKRLSSSEMSVWDDQHPQPDGGPDFERNLLRQLTLDTQTQLHQAERSLADFRNTVGPALDIVIGRNLAQTGDIEMEMKEKLDHDAYREMTGLLQNHTYGEALPVVFLHPNNWNKRTVLWIHPDGKAALYQPGTSQPAPPIKELLDAGISVAAVDLLYQGEFLPDGKPVTQTRRVNNTREAAAYTFGYNHTLFAQRVHDVLTLISFVKNHERGSRTVELVGLNGAGPWVAAARAQAGDAVNLAIIDTAGFRFGNVLDLHDPSFLPGGAKYGDLPGMLALAAPARLHLAGEGDHAPQLAVDLYQKAGASKNLTTFTGNATQILTTTTRFLIRTRDH